MYKRIPWELVADPLEPVLYPISSRPTLQRTSLLSLGLPHHELFASFPTKPLQTILILRHVPGLRGLQFRVQQQY